MSSTLETCISCSLSPFLSTVVPALLSVFEPVESLSLHRELERLEDLHLDLGLCLLRLGSTATGDLLGLGESSSDSLCEEGREHVSGPR